MKNRTQLLQGGWVAIVPLTIAIGIYLFVIFFPGMREIRALRAETIDNELAAADARRQAAQLGEIERQIAETLDYVRKWRGGGHSSQSVARAFGDVASLVKSSGAVTSTFRPESKTAYASFDRLPLQLGCRGTYDQIQALLASFDRLPHRIWVDEVTLERAAGNDGTIACEIKLAIFVDKFDISD